MPPLNVPTLPGATVADNAQAARNYANTHDAAQTMTWFLD